MRRTILLASYILTNLLAFPESLPAETGRNQTEVVAAREARDRASVEELEGIIEKEKGVARGNESFEINLRLALLQSWLCEAADIHKNDRLVKQAARDGLAAAERAAALNQQSSEAHQLIGELLNQLIPHVFGGGMRYGKRAANEMDKAIQLEPKNPRVANQRPTEVERARPGVQAELRASTSISLRSAPFRFRGNRPPA